MSELKFVPLYDHVVIKKNTSEIKSAGGIYLPPGSSEGKSYSDGIVVKVGEGYKLTDGKLRPLKVKEGDRIMYRKMTEIDVTIDGRDYFVLSEGNIIGVF
jgi:chaperonin GroES